VLEHERVAAVLAALRVLAISRADQPAAVPRLTQQGREACGGVEARQAQPVDRAVAADERCGLCIADERVVFDAQRQAPGAPRVPACRTAARLRFGVSSATAVMAFDRGDPG
jgi:hypothetical protein